MNTYTFNAGIILRNWIIRRVELFCLTPHCELAGLYTTKRNFWVVITRGKEGQLIIDNPRGVKIPKYAMEEVKRLLDPKTPAPR